MKIILIGHSIIDHFEGTEEKISKPGGVFYSTIGINSIKKSTDQIYLLSGWNRKSFHLFQDLYSKVELDRTNKLINIPEVYLKISSESEREETYKNMTENLSIKSVSNWNIFDGILINMITGADISLEQIKYIRNNFKGIIYFDVHTLSRGVDNKMKREFRLIPSVNEWLSCINILQCNENELETIVQYQNEINSAEKILSSGPNILIITKGERGAQVYCQFKGEVKNLFVNAIEVNSVNKIGCGDIFGAVFFYTYISTNDIYISLNRANKAGAVAASRNDLTSHPEIELND
ncbi:MAG: carbohydrate kinase family protein [Ignavibacteriales bacterium]|nr:carbohydrate kinase family protein [Ignavibacteriales bacterium]